MAPAENLFLLMMKEANEAGGAEEGTTEPAGDLILEGTTLESSQSSPL